MTTTAPPYVYLGDLRGRPGLNGSNVLPTDDAIAQAVSDDLAGPLTQAAIRQFNDTHDGLIHIETYNARTTNTEAENLTAIQNAIDALAGTGQRLYIPFTGDPFHVDSASASLQLRGRMVVEFDNRFVDPTEPADIPSGATANTATIVGNGGNAVFATGTYDPNSSSKLNRDIVVRGASVYNDGAPCFEALTAINLTLYQPSFRSDNLEDENTGALRARNSYRMFVQRARLICSGGAWAGTWRDNCNGIYIDAVASGGDAGGAIEVSQSTAVRIPLLVMEATLRGLWVAAYGVADDGGGNVNNLVAGALYAEQSSEAYRFGGVATITGLNASALWLNNAHAVENGFDPAYCVYIGKVRKSRIGELYLQRGAAEPTFKWGYDALASGNKYFQRANLVDVHVSGGTGPRDDFSEFPSPEFGLSRIYGDDNSIQAAGDDG